MLPRFLCMAVLAIAASGSAQERLNISTANGLRFASVWTSAGDNAPAALFFPMCWSTPPETWAPVAAALKTRGVSSLVTTYPGAPGNSSWPGPQPPPEPQAVYWTAQFRQVTEAAFAYVNARTPRPMVIAGSSCGVDRALDTAMAHPDRVAGVVVFAGAHSPEQLKYVSTGHVPVLGVTSRWETEWVAKHPLLVEASKNPASRMMLSEQQGHGTEVLRDRQLADDIAAWISDRLNRK